MASPGTSRTYPFMAFIKERYSLHKEGAEKETLHIVLGTKGFPKHRPGDSIGILPLNAPEAIERLLVVLDDEARDHWLFFQKEVNLKDATYSLLEEMAPSEQKEYFLRDKEAWKTYIATREIAEVIRDLWGPTSFPFCLLKKHLKPLLPRFYSIASSGSVHPHEIHLMVSIPKRDGEKDRMGVCSYFLSHLVPLGEPSVPIYLQPSRDFTIPYSAEASMIMVGPGTGVAPFRAFMQERLFCGHTGENWLFFGERRRASDFLYQDFWERLQQEKKLRLDVAFSRDQGEKVYVQHCLWERGAEVMEWLHKGAYFFVCGDASEMARAIDQVLLEIVKNHTPCSSEEAKNYVHTLRKEKRYVRDVY